MSEIQLYQPFEGEPPRVILDSAPRWIKKNQYRSLMAEFLTPVSLLFAVIGMGGFIFGPVLWFIYDLFGHLGGATTTAAESSTLIHTISGLQVLEGLGVAVAGISAGWFCACAADNSRYKINTHTLAISSSKAVALYNKTTEATKLVSEYDLPASLLTQVRSSLTSAAVALDSNLRSQADLKTKLQNTPGDTPTEQALHQAYASDFATLQDEETAAISSAEQLILDLRELGLSKQLALHRGAQLPKLNALADATMSLRDTSEQLQTLTKAYTELAALTAAE